MILPFSTFVTQIPFILMALVYLVFFGVSALSKTSQKETVQLSDNQKHIKEVRESIKTLPGKTVNYYTLASADQNEAVNDEPIRAPEWRPCKNTRFIAERSRINQNFFSHSIFCRPPPVLA